jgi:hypothetical protein
VPLVTGEVDRTTDFETAEAAESQLSGTGNLAPCVLHEGSEYLVVAGVAA